MKSIEKRVKYLSKTLKELNEQYYINNVSLVSDTVYDEMLKELKGLEKKHPKLKETDSPTNIVGNNKIDNRFKKVKLDPRMMSLGNIFNFDELEKFDNSLKKDLGVTNITYCVERKIDGLSFEAVYEYGKLVRGCTRGNGYEGEDITHNLLVIDDIPKYIKDLENVSEFKVRGEIYMGKETFNKINKQREEQNEPLLANPRNAASGTLRQLDSNIVKKRGLNAFAYYIVEPQKLGIQYQGDVLSKLKDLGFKVQEDNLITGSIDIIKDFIVETENKRGSLSYDIDGIVLKVNRLDFQGNLGETSKAPKWAIAYKLTPERAYTVIESIDFYVGRTGIVTPVANLTPVNLDGTIVRRATLHNKDFMNRLDLKLGDTIEIQKAGDIIPEVIKVNVEKRTGDEKKIDFPKVCPYCGDNLIKLDGEVDYRCINSNCTARVKEGIKHFVSKNAMNIDGFGEKTVEDLFNRELIKNIFDIYSLKYKDLIDIEGMGEKSVTKLLEAINKSKENSLERLLFGLGIPYLG